jgi:hypothetical protein
MRRDFGLAYREQFKACVGVAFEGDCELIEIERSESKREHNEYCEYRILHFTSSVKHLDDAVLS